MLSYKPERYPKEALFINSASVYRLITPFVRQYPKARAEERLKLYHEYPQKQRKWDGRNLIPFKKRQQPEDTAISNAK